MASDKDQATFAVNLGGNAADAATTAANAMDGLRQRIAAGQLSIKEMAGSLRNLRGSTDEVKAAKGELKAKLDSEREAISKATLALLKEAKATGTAGEGAKKLGEKIKGGATEHKKLADTMKKDDTKHAADRTKALGSAISAAGGPVASLRDKFATLKDAMGEGGAGGAMSLLAGGAAAVVAAVVAVAVAVGASLVSLAKFVLKSADAARSAGLLREAAMGGNAQWGKNFGEQVDALAKKVPTSKAEIDKLGISLAKSRIGGQVWVDTLNAVTQASAALGDDAGNKLKEFVERGRQFGRFQINPQEMIGTGVDFKDVAEALAKSMHVGVKAAQTALFEGRVKLADGAAAMRAAVEKKFGGINLRQMISLENLSKKLGETFEELTKGVDLEPILKGLKEMASIFDVSTTSGQALKQIVTVFGKELGGAFTSTTPLAKKFVYGLIIGALKLENAYLQVRNNLRETFGNSEVLKNVDWLKLAVEGGTVAIYGLGAALLMTAGFAAAAAAPFVLVGTALYGLCVSVQTVYDLITETDWNGLGMAIPNGLIDGLKSGATRLTSAVTGLADNVKKTFTSALRMGSPSKVFEEYGVNTPAGYARGVEKGSDVAQNAVDAMVAVPSGGGGGGSAKAAGAAPVTLNVTINVSGSNAQEIASKLASSSVLEQLYQHIVDAVHGGGIPVPS